MRRPRRNARRFGGPRWHPIGPRFPEDTALSRDRNPAQANGLGRLTEPMRVLLVSSFVLPHAGGVEQFVAAIRDLLEQRDCCVRVLACGRPGIDTTADAVLPARYLGTAGWPLPVGGWRTLWNEVTG